MKTVLQRLRQTLLVPAAEYVPAITDALDIIDAALSLPDPSAAPVVPGRWDVFNSGAIVAGVLSMEEAFDYLTDERLARGWCAVCVVNADNPPPPAPQQGEQG